MLRQVKGFFSRHFVAVSSSGAVGQIQDCLTSKPLLSQKKKLRRGEKLHRGGEQVKKNISESREKHLEKDRKVRSERERVC